MTFVLEPLVSYLVATGRMIETIRIVLAGTKLYKMSPSERLRRLMSRLV